MLLVTSTSDLARAIAPEEATRNVQLELPSLPLNVRVTVLLHGQSLTEAQWPL